MAGRDAAHILLIHANALAADHLGEVLDHFRTQGGTFVSLTEALADPIYGQDDRYTGARGFSWLYRIDPNRTKTEQLWDEQKAARIVRTYGR